MFRLCLLLLVVWCVSALNVMGQCECKTPPTIPKKVQLSAEPTTEVHLFSRSSAIQRWHERRASRHDALALHHQTRNTVAVPVTRPAASVTPQRSKYKEEAQKELLKPPQKAR